MTQGHQRQSFGSKTESLVSPADNLAEHTPDKGHVLKCNNNSLFKLRDEDKTLKGVHALTNQRIKSMNADVSKALAEYQEIGIGNTVARKACLEQIEAIVPHHCGKHEKCKHEKWCTYVQVKSKHPDWNESQIAEEAARISTWPFDGRNMSLSEDGISVLTAKLVWRFNDKTIDKCASGGCSNLSENFWNMNTKFSEGKRLNHDHTDSWEVVNKLSFCRKGEGNIEKTHNQVADKLGLPVLSPEVTYEATATKRSVKRLTMQHSTKFKLRRSFAKMSRDHRMGKIDTKKIHRSGKVPLMESAKSSIGKAKQKSKTGPRQCSTCKQFCHTARDCKMPLGDKQSQVELVDFDLGLIKRCKQYGIKPRKRRKPLGLFDPSKL